MKSALSPRRGAWGSPQRPSYPPVKPHEAVCYLPSTSSLAMKKMVRGTSFLSRSKGKAGAPADEPAVSDSSSGTIPTPASAAVGREFPQQQPMAMSGQQSPTLASSSAADDNDALRRESNRLREENETLKGQVHLLKFKVDLLVDMVTLANLDCDKLEDEVSMRAASSS